MNRIFSLKNYVIKRIIAPTVILLICLAFAPGAAASVNISNLFFDDGSGFKKYSEPALSNFVDITAVTNSSVDEVTINGKEAKKHSGEWDVYNVELKPGKNVIQVVATDLGKKEKKTEKFEINYADSNAAGLNYIVNDLTAAGNKLKLFNGAFQLNLPKNPAVMYNEKIAPYQKVKFSVSTPSFKPSSDTNYISNIFSFTANYSYDCTINGQAELVFQYDPLVSGTDSYLLTVLRLEPMYAASGFSFPLVQNLGGVVDTKAHTITVKTTDDVFGSYVVVKKTGDFLDFYPRGGVSSPVAWSRPYVLYLWSKGIMEPLKTYPGGKAVDRGYFGLVENNAEVPITRLEMAKLIVKVLRLPNSLQESVVMPTYADLYRLDLFDRMQIEAATRNGLFSGFPGKNGGLEFRPEQPVTREQAAVILARALGAELPDPVKASAYIKAYFKNDYNKINEWACPYLLVALQQGLLQPAEPGYMRPDQKLSRAEAARAIYLLGVRLKLTN